MSIATEFESTRENVQKAYDSLSKLGETATNKNIENISGLIDNIYNRLPKTTYQEGTNINLGKTLKAVVQYEDDKVLYGDTSQKSYNGYNLLNIDTITSYEKSGVTISYDNGYLKLNGTATAQFDIYLNVSNVTNYSAFKNYANANYDTYQMVLENNNYGLKFYARYTESGTTQYSQNSFTTSETESLGDNFIRVSSGTTFNNALIGVMIEKGSTAHDFEPYTGGIPSPNPSYPQPIQVVTGTQEVVVKNGNNETQEIYTIHLGSLELAKIGTYQDYIYFDVDEGKWYKKGLIGKAQISSFVNKAGATANNIYTTDVISNIKKPASNANLSELFSNYFTAKVPNQMYTNDLIGIGTLTTGSVYCGFGANTTLTTLELANAWVTSNNIIIYYQLTTPTTEEITDSTLIQDLDNILAMMSVEGNTIIEVSGNLPAPIKVRAIKGE